MLLFYLFYNLRTKISKNHIVYFLLLIIALGIFFKILSQSPIFNDGLNRGTSFFSFTEGISWENTSNRGSVYGKAIEAIKNSPVYGYGFYEYLFKYSYNHTPHNIILEVLLQGGIVYLIFSITIFIFVMIKFICMIKNNKKIIELGFIFLYPLTKLLFSSSYSFNAIFWFFIIYVYAYELKPKKA